MNRKEFLMALAETTETAGWLPPNMAIRGVNDCCPMTAVWYHKGGDRSLLAAAHWQQAADALSIGPRLRLSIVRAADGCWGGNPQAVKDLRADMLKALGLEEPQ